MPLQIHQWYSVAEIFAEFADAGPNEILCDGQFAIFSDATACLITLGHSSAQSGFASASRFSWKPQRLDYALDEPFPWFPEAVRETWSDDRTQQIRQHHLFTKTPSDQHYFYVGPVHLASYGHRSVNEVFATFSLKTALPRHAWLHFGGSLLPRKPFASLPVVELDSRNVKFHHKTLDMLHVSPPQSAAANASLNQLEQRLSVLLPVSVREWYSLAGCMEIMHELSLIHTPVDVVNYSDDLSHRYAASPPYLRMLPIVIENQGVWHIAVALDVGDDPPVYLGYQDRDTFEWHLHAEHFSEFVYAWSWDYVGYERDYIINTTAYLSEADIARIHAAFQLQATTYVGNAYFVSERIERYVKGDQKITLMIDQKSTDIWFSAEAVASLESLLRGLWSSSNRLDQVMNMDLEMQKMYLW
jgi:hypothetical protein